MYLKRKSIVVTLLLVLALSLSACGLDEYADATNAALASYNSATEAVSQQLFMINDDNAIVSDPDWKSETLAAADALESAAQAFASLPETPAGYEEVDSLLTSLAFETTSYTDTVRDLVENEDLSLTEEVDSQIQALNDLVSQIDVAITAANE